MVSESQKRAKEKYDTKFNMVRFRMKLEKYDKLMKMLNETGESIASLFNRLADKELEEYENRKE